MRSKKFVAAALGAGLGTPISRLASVSGHKTPIGRLVFPGGRPLALKLTLILRDSTDLSPLDYYLVAVADRMKMFGLWKPVEGLRVRIGARRLSRVVLISVAGSLILAASCSGPAPSVEQGRSLYRENGCGSCHGASGRGDGPLAASLIVRPANLHDPAHFKRGASEVEIARTLAEGIHDMQGSTPQLHENHHDLAMPKFDHLSEVERRSIALYVISMQKNDN